MHRSLLAFLLFNFVIQLTLLTEYLTLRVFLKKIYKRDKDYRLIIIENETYKQKERC